MKKTLFLSLCVILLGAGCNSYSQEQQKIADLEFKRNQACADYLTSIKETLKKQEDDLNKTGYQIGVSVNIILNKVFYSSKHNSCLYSVSFEQRLSEDGKKATETIGDMKLRDTNMTIVKNLLTEEVLFRSEAKEEVDEWIALNTK